MDVQVRARSLAARTGASIIVTLGGEGALLVSPDGRAEKVPPLSVAVRDTTGAGDTFNGVLATRLALGDNLGYAVRVASTAAALFRIGSGRRVRQVDTGGDDPAFAGSLLLLRHAAGRRRGVFLLVCNEWTGAYSTCAAPQRAAGPPCRRLRSREPMVALCEVADEDGLHPS